MAFENRTLAVASLA